MKIIISVAIALLCGNVNSQPWSSNGICDFVDGTKYSNGNTTGCACTWYSIDVLSGDTTLNCAFGNCGQSYLEECVFDCNGHGGAPTISVARECDATAVPVCWFQGGGSAGELFCAGIAMSIELVDFWGNSTPKYNEILWAVSSQTDNDYFTISHSTDGLSFKEIGMLDGEGTTNNFKLYRFLHIAPKLGINYYKLKQTDFNGEYAEFPVIAINTKHYPGTDVFTDVYPNPSNGLFYINYKGKNFGTPIEISILNVEGVVVRETSIDKFNNSQAIAFDMEGLSKGYYHMKLTQEQINPELGGLVNETKKFVIVK